MTFLSPDACYPDTLATVYRMGYCHLEAFLKRNGRTQFSNKTVGDIRRESPGKKVVVLPLGQVMELIEAEKDAKFVSDWTEIDEERWNDMLCVLPPEKWQTVDGVNLFRMCEYTTGNITTHFARCGGRYFERNCRTTVPYATQAALVAALCS